MIIAGLITLTACTKNSAPEDAHELPLRCQAEAADGCLTLRNPLSNAPGPSYAFLSTRDGDPVEQYGITHTFHFGHGQTFTRPLKPGEYVVSFFEGAPRSFSVRGWRSERACGRNLRIRTESVVDLRIVWPRRDEGCAIVRR